MPLFTRENAAEMARRANQVRWHPEPEPQPTVIQPAIAEQSRDMFTEERLARVREMIDKLDKMLLDEDDPQALSWLATASSRLADQEFDYAGRPKPGNRRPPPEPVKRQVRTQAQLDSDPVPPPTTQ